MTSIVAIIGRPNVGKSTLFNRLSRSRDSLVDDLPGVTRDRIYASILWDDIPLMIIDTGGFDEQDKEIILNQVRGQVMKAVEEADQIIFLTDGQEGLMPGDMEIADILRRSQKRIFTVVNKIDGPEKDHLIHDFYQLGADKVYPISSAHGYGLNALMEGLTKGLPREELPAEDDSRIRVAVLGRPNTGKSSVINRILGADRLLVSELPGTTRDSIDILYKLRDREYLLIDTAGIRRKGRVKEKIEKISMIKTLRSLDRCHVAVVLLDSADGVMEQDARICGYALDRGRGLILAVNKWDLIKKDNEKIKGLNEAIDRQLQFASFAPRINLSALTGENVHSLFNIIDMVYAEFSTRIDTPEVNRAVEEMIRKRPPPSMGNTRIKYLYATQTGIRPPTFVVFVNRPEMIHFSYKRFIVNYLRDRFGLNHIPIRLIFRKRKKD